MTQFKNRIQKGLNGEYQGLANGLDRINKYIFYTQRACFYLIGGGSGSGKTTFVDFILLNAIQDAEAKGIPINIFYYSYEIREEVKKANWMSQIIYNKYDVIIPPERIMGLGDERMDSNEQEMVNSEHDYLESLFAKIMWRWETANPTGHYKEWWDFMSARGTFEYQDYIDENGNSRQRIVSYKLNDSREYNITVTDHVSLLKHERGFDLKQNLDKYSEYCVQTRNMFGMTHFLLQQFNSAISSIDRQKFKGVNLLPNQSDFKDSTNIYQDADIAFGLLNAYKLDMDTCNGYYINSEDSPYNLKGKFRLLCLIKNRLSMDNIQIGLHFKPQAGYFKELPIASQMTPEKYQEILNS